MAAIFTVPCFFLNESGSDEIVQGALDGATGKLQVRSDGVDGGPAVLSLAGAVFEVHIDRPGPMGKLVGRGGINCAEIAHENASFTF